MNPVVINERPADHRFTFAYSQPVEYRFCQDSVIFPHFVASRIKTGVTSVLDIGAGCGVIGFELAHYLPAITRVDFLEVQAAFRPHVEANARLTGKDFRFLNMNYADLLSPEFADAYDLIVSNPPYFYPGEGKTSPNEINNRARFFMDADFQKLILAVQHALSPGGEAFLLMKPGTAHGRDAFAEVKRVLRPDAGAEVVADIRGTSVLRLARTPA